MSRNRGRRYPRLLVTVQRIWGRPLAALRLEAPRLVDSRLVDSRPGLEAATRIAAMVGASSQMGVVQVRRSLDLRCQAVVLLPDPDQGNSPRTRPHRAIVAMTRARYRLELRHRATTRVVRGRPTLLSPRSNRRRLSRAFSSGFCLKLLLG